MTDVVSQYVSGRTVQEQMCELMKFVSTVNGKSVKKIEGTQSDDTVTVTVTYEDDRTDVFSFQSTLGVTVDTAQTISGMKVFSAASTQFTHDVDVGGDMNTAGMLEVGEDAEIDGDVNCQNATIAGNLKVSGAVQDNIEFTGDNVEIGAMSLEKDGQMTVISNSNGIKIADDTGMIIPDTQTGIRDKKAVNGNRLQNDLDAYASMVRTTGNQVIGGIKTLNVKPVLKRIYARNDSFASNWVRICSFAANSSYGDMHMITRFMSGNTEPWRGSMNFCVDIMQRIQSTLGKNGISLVDNACQVKPLAIGIAPVIGTSVGLKMISDHDSGTIEIWGCFAHSRVIVEVEAFARINNLPAGSCVVFADDMATGIDDKTTLDANVTWDLQTLSSTEPVGARTNNYILRGQEVTQ